MNLIFNSIDYVNLLTINRLYFNYMKIKLDMDKNKIKTKIFKEVNNNAKM